LVWGVIASLYLGNAMLLMLNLPLVGLWVKLLSIPRPGSTAASSSSPRSARSACIDRRRPAVDGRHRHRRILLRAIDAPVRR
jgi:hypothetical protein